MKNIDWVKSLNTKQLTDFILFTYTDIHEIRCNTLSREAMQKWFDKEQSNVCPKCGCSSQFDGIENDEVSFQCPFCGNIFTENDNGKTD